MDTLVEGSGTVTLPCWLYYLFIFLYLVCLVWTWDTEDYPRSCFNWGWCQVCKLFVFVVLLPTSLVKSLILITCWNSKKSGKSLSHQIQDRSCYHVTTNSSFPGQSISLLWHLITASCCHLKIWMWPVICMDCMYICLSKSCFLTCSSINLWSLIFNIYSSFAGCHLTWKVQLREQRSL